MLTVNIHDAKTQLSRLVERAADGETFIIAKAGKPMVKVVALQPGDIGTSQRLGFMSGEIRVPDDFNQMGQDEIERNFATTPSSRTMVSRFVSFEDDLKVRDATHSDESACGSGLRPR